MTKRTKNQAPTATQKLWERCQKMGIEAEIIQESKPRSRRYSPSGSTAAPQKVIVLAGIEMSIGQAREYVMARARSITGNQPKWALKNMIRALSMLPSLNTVEEDQRLAAARYIRGLKI